PFEFSPDVFVCHMSSLVVRTRCRQSLYATRRDSLSADCRGRRHISTATMAWVRARHKAELERDAMVGAILVYPRGVRGRLHKMSTTDDFDAALAASDAGPVWLLKHSMTCGISDEAFSEFSEHAGDRGPDTHWVLTVQKSPALSRAVAT